jgi:mono/diheme cytochrome c family protein
VPSRSQEVARLFRDNCAACHGEDGTGNNLRKVWPLLPDFTNLAWQMSQTEMALVNQIHYGSRPLMPAFRDKLSANQILRLAVHVRSFAAHPAPAQVSLSSNITAASVFGTHCFVCHDTGRGNPLIRPAMPELPDFTTVAWQKSRTDADLAQSILLGKGKFMRPMADKLGTVDMRQIVALVRGFQGGKQVIPSEAPAVPGPSVPVIVATPSTPTPSTDLPALGASIVGSISFPPGQGSFLAAFAVSRRGTSLTIGSIPRPGSKDEQPLPVQSEAATARIRLGATIFRQYCIVCHGLDGKGTNARPTLPPIPDFTNAAWHRERSDAQLRVSILEGKGTMMPANRGRVTEEQAGDLVAFVRTFGPAKLLTSKTQAADSDFEKSFRQLDEQFNQLAKELQKIGAQK